MSEPISADVTAAAPTHPPAAAQVSLPTQLPPPLTAAEVDAEIMAVLAKTQNKCFSEMGYYPSLLQEHHELQKQYALLRSDNQKLYSDNYNLAQFIQAQEQRINAMAAPKDQQKRAFEEMEGRLHAALNEIMLLRQELSRFIPSALMVPAHERLAAQSQQVAQQRAVPVPVAQQVVAEQLPSVIPYKRPPPPQQQPRPIQPLPASRQSLPSLSPIDTSAPPTIANHRRTSAPGIVMSGHPNGAGPSSASASPLGNFSGLSLASPATPMSSRPSTAGGPTAGPHDFAQRSVSGPVSSLHRIPTQPQRSSTSSLAGAIIDLTAEESQAQDGSRKRRKTDHTPEMASSPSAQPYPTQTATPITPSSWNPPDRYNTAVQLDAPHAPPPETNANHVAPTSDSHPTNVGGQQSSDPSPPQPPGEDVAMEQQPTIEEDCIEANFVEDDEDEEKLWCMMCRSRFKAGHTTETPQPFVDVSQQELIAHCESVHPRGWETLKLQVAKQRSAASEPV